MSKMAELSYDIEQLYINDWGTHKIAEVLECPIEVVEQWLKDNNLSDCGNLIDEVDQVGETVFRNMVEELSCFETMNS